MRILVGTSGWQYRDWKNAFYPKEVTQSGWLEHYAQNFRTVEVNNTFYRLPERKTFEDWAARTPDDFIFTVKASRYLTHIKRLQGPAEPVARLMERAAGLGPKLGPVLLQLPPNFKKDETALAETLDAFGTSTQIVMEFRHPSWFDEQIRLLLEEKGAAFCMADRGSRPITPIWRTGSVLYLRFHEGRASPRPCYGKASLLGWVERIGSLAKPGDEVYVYFNNDTRACAIRDAEAFAGLAADRGIEVTRAPGLVADHLVSKPR